MAFAGGVRSQRVGPWGRVTVVLELVLLTYAWGWIARVAASAVGLDASRGVTGGTYLAWAALATPGGLALVLLALRLRGESPATIGLARPTHGWWRAQRDGLLWGAGLFALSHGATWLAGQFGLETEHGLFRIESASSWLTWVAGGLLAGAFGEELLYRGWLLERVERGLAGLVPEAWATRAAVLAGALTFGAQHAYQGASAVAIVTLLGLGLGAAFLRSGRNLVVPVVAHGVLDIVGLTQIHLSR